jgi:Bacterial protein of unknown function (DUF916)./Protein of unknown function C-terminal (DUF3324).
MKKVFYCLTVFLFAFIAFISIPKTVLANVQGITVTPMVNDSDTTDRFQILGDDKKGSTRKLKISIGNFSINKVRLLVTPTNATTSSDGKIVYTDSVEAGDFGLKYAFSDMTKPQTVTLKPNQTKDITFNVKLPNGNFKGLILGGFDIHDTTGASKGNSSVPVWITQDNKPVGGKLDLYDMTLGVFQHQPHIYVNLENKRPGMMKNVIVHMTVKRQSWLDRFNLGPTAMVDDTKYSKVAPNSKIPVDFNQNQTPITPGKYVVKGVARSGKAVWNFKHTYTITEKQAYDINKRCRNLIYDKTITYILISLVLVTIIVFIFWGIWHQNRR